MSHDKEMEFISGMKASVQLVMQGMLDGWEANAKMLNEKVREMEARMPKELRGHELSD